MKTKEKYISRIDNLMFISYDGNNRFILPKLLLRCLKTWMFCFVEDWWKTDFQSISGCEG